MSRNIMIKAFSYLHSISADAAVKDIVKCLVTSEINCITLVFMVIYPISTEVTSLLKCFPKVF